MAIQSIFKRSILHIFTIVIFLGIAFAFSSSNFVILAGGSYSKAIAIGYMAPILAGVLITFRGRMLLGAILTGVALSLQILAGHLQITYDALIMILFFGAGELYCSAKLKQQKNDFNCQYEEKISSEEAAIGTPCCITVDHQTLRDNVVIIRYRDTI